MDQTGYIKDWTSDVEYVREGKSLGADRIGPNSPSFQYGLGIYIKTSSLQPYPVAMIEVSREPGAVWASIGGILFMAGTTTLLLFKIKRGGKLKTPSCTNSRGLRPVRRESQCKVYFFHYIRSLTLWQDYREYRSLSIYEGTNADICCT